MDVADILGLGSRSSAPSASRPAPAPKRPLGMAREVYNLLGPHATLPVSCIPTESKSTAYKERKGRVKAKRWVWAQIYNSARNGVNPLDPKVTPGSAQESNPSHPKIYHWQREDTLGNDYAFSRFNKPNIVVNYTDQQYASAHMALGLAPSFGSRPEEEPNIPSIENSKGDQKNTQAASDKGDYSLHDTDKWTREETDHLFSLCVKYGSNWPVILDRWNSSRGKQKRSMQSLKARYFNLSKEVLSMCASSFEAKVPAESSKGESKASASLVKPKALDVAFAVAQASAPKAATPIPIMGGIDPKASASDVVRLKKKARAMFEALKEFEYDESSEEARCRRNDRLFLRSDEEEREEMFLLGELKKVDAQLRAINKRKIANGKISKRSSRGNKTTTMLATHLKDIDSLSWARTEVELGPDPTLHNEHLLKRRQGKDKKAGAPSAVQAIPSKCSTVSLRSARLEAPPTTAGVGASILEKVKKLLKHLGVPDRPMPTYSICCEYDKLRQDAIKLLAMQKRVRELAANSKKLSRKSLKPFVHSAAVMAAIVDEEEKQVLESQKKTQRGTSKKRGKKRKK